MRCEMNLPSNDNSLVHQAHFLQGLGQGVEHISGQGADLRWLLLGSFEVSAAADGDG